MTDRDDFALANFCENLSLACSYYPSITEVARRIGINRQQFMRYLAGGSFPSRHNLRRVCDFFGVDEFELLMPHDQFRKIVQLRPNQSDNVPVAPAALSDVLNTAQRQQGALGRYLGYYYGYYWSFSRPGLILRSLTHIFAWRDFTCYRRIERLRRPGGGRPDVYKYEGMMLSTGDRLHLVDRETIAKAELTHTILYPVYRNRVTSLTGLTMGISGADTRYPSASRVVLEYIGRRVALRQTLEGCGAFAPTSAEVPNLVRSYLTATPVPGLPAQATPLDA